MITTDLSNRYDELLLERARLDKFFSIFLNEYDLEEEELDSPVWVTYKSKLNEYSSLNLKIKTVEFKLQGKLK